MADQARIYALVNPALIAEAQDVITQVVFRILGVTDAAKHEMVVSEASGWISYVAKEELWTRQYPPVLPSANVARQRAEAFLAAVSAATAIGARSWPENLAQVSLLPRLMRPVQISVVPRANGSAWDHWLYRAQPRLVLDPAGRRSVPVFGSHIEIRIGERGQVVGFRSRWRPLSGERITVDLAPFNPPAAEEGEEHHHGNAQPPHALQYVLDGDGVPQHYLAPYYFMSDGHMLQTVSASPFSLTVKFGRVQGKDTMLVSAEASGGSGDYAYNFAAYVLDRVEDGYSELGRGRSFEVESATGSTRINAVEIPNGAYIVMVNVRDRATGAFKHSQQQIVSTRDLGELHRLPDRTPVA